MGTIFKNSTSAQMVANPFTNSKKNDNPAILASAKLESAAVKFKDSREVLKMIKGKPVDKAIKYLLNVIDRKEAVTATKFKNGRGRHAMAKQYNQTVCFWPQKVCKMILQHISNAKNNALQKGLNSERLVIQDCQANACRKIFKRTFMAHGKVAAFQKSPCHLFITIAENQGSVPVPAI